jgi:hypothetical protein
MPKKIYPLELVLRAHGTAELLNAEEDILWTSDSDDDFKEEITDEFLQEEDIGDVLEYLVDNDIINEKEFKLFEAEHWDCIIESLDNNEPDDDDEEDEEDEEEHDSDIN